MKVSANPTIVIFKLTYCEIVCCCEGKAFLHKYPMQFGVAIANLWWKNNNKWEEKKKRKKTTPLNLTNRFGLFGEKVMQSAIGHVLKHQCTHFLWHVNHTVKCFHNVGMIQFAFGSMSEKGGVMFVICDSFCYLRSVAVFSQCTIQILFMLDFDINKFTCCYKQKNKK